MKHIAHPITLFLLTVILGFLIAFGCTKPTPFGAGLLDSDMADFAYTDTITLKCTIVPEDSALTSDRASTASYFLCGQLNDPLFGHAQSDIYTLFRLSNLGPNFKTAQIDSVVMYLRYNAEGFYGDSTQEQDIRVHRLAVDAPIKWDSNYYSNQSLAIGQQIGEVQNFLPRPTSGLQLFDTTSQAPYLRIPLDNAFGQELLDMDSLTLISDSTFWSVLRGIRISAEPKSDPGAMMAFDLNNTTYSRIRLYYKYDADTITTSRFYDFFFVGGNKFTNFTHDYSGSEVEQYINQQSDDFLFVQGMTGLQVKVEMPYAHLLDDIAVNKAELEVSVASLPNENSILSPANQLALTRTVGDTAVSFTSDVLYSLGISFNTGFDFFGGTPKQETDNGMTVTRYRLTMTRRFQDIVDNTTGDLDEQTVFINVYPQSRSAMRAVLFGPKNAEFPAKLSLKYTRVK